MKLPLLLLLVTASSVCARPPPRDDEIIGGTPVALSSAFPFMASIARDGEHMCGATIISPTLVVTAAHCMFDRRVGSDGAVYYEPVLEREVRVNVGRVERTSDLSTRYRVKDIVPHPEYDRTTHDNDVAVLRLFKPLQWSDSVQSIRLGSPSGTVFTALGWGVVDTAKDKELAAVLQQVQLQLGDPQACDSVSPGYAVHGLLCAGFKQGGKDTCWGDSGGPLLANGTLVGITSYGKGVAGVDGCGRRGDWGFYTRVDRLVEWLSHMSLS